MLDMGMFGQNFQSRFDQSPVQQRLQSRFANSQGFQRLGDILSFFTNLGGGSKSFNDPAPVQTDPTTVAPTPMGDPYNNPFGAGVTGGTLGAMLARQPTY